MHRFILALVLGGLSVGANAATVDFESYVSPAAGSTPVVSSGFSDEIDGLTLAAGGINYSIAPADWADARSNLSFANNGTNYGRCFTNSGAPCLLLSSPEYFSLSSIDLAEYGSTSFPSLLDSVLVTGYRSDGTQLTRSILLDNIVDGMGGQDDFEIFAFDTSWSDLWKVDLGPADGPARNIFSFDNIVYQNSGVLNTSYAGFLEDYPDIDDAPVPTIPIPATFWLFGSALGLLGWMRRRKR
jgi:hypothetical protein